MILLLLGAAIGLLAALFALWLLGRRRVALLERALADRDAAEREARGQLGEARIALARLEVQLGEERKAAQEKVELLSRAREAISQELDALVGKALQGNSKTFLELAHADFAKEQERARAELAQRAQSFEALVLPVRESLAQLDRQLRESEIERKGTSEALGAQLRGLLEAQGELRREAGGLTRALRTPHVRGLWGEMQLRRVVEMAGMLRHCDFEEQAVSAGNAGALRPDMVVHLPGGRSIVIDAKTTLAAYLDAQEATTEEERKACLRDHARHVREKVGALARKEYWAQFEQSPELVVLFLPAESFFSAAFDEDKGLVEYAFANGIAVATPMTLMALLKAVAYGWKQQTVAEHAREVSALGAELHARLCDMGSHFEDLGGALEKAVKCFNKTVGSLESRVLVSARKFRAFGATAGEKELPQLAEVELHVRSAGER